MIRLKYFFYFDMANNLHIFVLLHFQMCAKLKMMPPSVFLARAIDSYRRR